MKASTTTAPGTGLAPTPIENKGNLVDPKSSKGVAVVIGAARMLFTPPESVEVYDDMDTLDSVEREEKTGQRVLPIMRLLQSGSPQVKKGPNKVEGAEEGDIINTSTGQIYKGDRGLYFVPARAHQKYVEYKDRDEDGNGGGFLGIFESDNPYVSTYMVAYRKEHGMDEGAAIYDRIPSGKTEDGKDTKSLVETWYIDGVWIVPNDDGSCPGELGTTFEASFAFSSTLISEYRRWDERLKGMKYNVPDKASGKLVPKEVVSWAHIWHLKTISHPKSTASRSWMTTKLTWAGKDEKGAELPYRSSRLPKEENLYKQANALFKELLEGNIGHAYAKDGDGSEQPRGEVQNGNGTDDSNDPPFPKI